MDANDEVFVSLDEVSNDLLTRTRTSASADVAPKVLRMCFTAIVLERLRDGNSRNCDEGCQYGNGEEEVEFGNVNHTCKGEGVNSTVAQRRRDVSVVDDAGKGSDLALKKQRIEEQKEEEEEGNEGLERQVRRTVQFHMKYDVIDTNYGAWSMIYIYH